MMWQPASIVEITEVVTKGTTPTTYGMPFTDDGVNFVKAEALNGDAALDHGGFNHISEDTHVKLARSNLKENDVLITIAGANVGRCGFVRNADLPANTNQAVGIIRVDPKRAHPKFVYYHFKNPKTFAYCQSLGGQAAQPNINLTVLKGFTVDAPDIEQQKRIASILSIYDDLIENNRRRIALLQDAARQLYKEWFVRFRFPGHEHVSMTNGVPEGWEIGKLGDIVTTNQKSFSAKNLPETLRYIDISAVNRGEITANLPMPSSEAPGRARRIAAHGDVIWSNVRPNLRAYALVINPDEIDVFSTGFTILSSSTLPYSFLYLLTTTDAFVNYLVNQTTGASYPAVRPDDFERADIIVPAPAVLSAFHEMCAPNFELAALLHQQNNQLAKARDLLLPKLMNGTLTV